MSDSETRRPRHALVDDEVVAPETDSAEVDVPEVDVPKIDVPAPAEPRDDVVGPEVVEPAVAEPDVVEPPVAEPAAEEAPAGTGDAATDPTESPTTALPVQRAAWPAPPVPGEYTDDATMVLPVIPAQRAASPAGHPMRGGQARPALPDYSYPAAPVAPKRRVLPAVLAAATAVLLVAGIAVGIGGAPAELATPPAPTANP